MAKLLTLAGTLALAAFARSSNAAEDSCVPIDFTTEDSEFADLNAALGLVEIANMVGSLFGNYDPLVLRNVSLANFNYSILGQKLTITPTVDTVKITGLTNVVPQHVNVTSSNSVDFAAESESQVSVDASVSITVAELGATAKAHLVFGMVKPSLLINIEANMYACAPGVSSSLCSNMTVAGLQLEAVKAAIFGNYDSVVKEVLMKFEDASVKSFKLDFASVSKFKIDFDSSNFVLSAITNLLSEYSADEVNRKGTVYNTVISTISRHAPALLNNVIASKLKPWFGATCLSEN
ncbi:hypothetical protein PRIC2_007608 [Phytophthora ramorum]